MNDTALSLPSEPLPVTDADRAAFPYHTEDSIRGIKLVRQQSTSCLLALSKDEVKREPLLLAVGTNTNPLWLMERIAATLYDRGAIDERELDRLIED